MKKLILTLTGCMLVLAASAQTIEKGSIFANPAATNIGFNSINLKPEGGESSSTSLLGFQARGGYAIADDLALMAGIGYQNVSSDGTGAGLFNVSAGVRKYISSGFYGGANLVFGSLSMKNNANGGGTSTGTTIGAEVNAGYSLFLSKNFAVEPSINFMYGLSTKMQDAKFNLSVLSINIGFTYKLDDLVAPKSKAVKGKPAAKKK